MPIMNLLNAEIEVRSIEVKPIRELPDLRTGLKRPRYLEWLSPSANTTEIIDEVKSKAPTDGIEIVGWMQDVAAINAVLDTWKQSYEGGGTAVVYASGDPYIPGVSADGMYYASEPGWDIDSRGYGTLSTPIGTQRIPKYGQKTIIGQNFLGFGALPWTGGIQWIGTFMRWKDLARTPIKNRISFASGSNWTAPNFFNCTPKRIPVSRLFINVTSDKPQTISLTGRSTGNYESEMFKTQINVPAGQSQNVVTLVSFPMRPFVLEMQPQIGTTTILDELVVSP